MNTAVLVARLFLVGVFALAGVAKFLNPAGSREAVEGFGVPTRLVRAVASGLPVVELAIAAALLPTPTARWAGVGAALIMAVFAAGVARVLRQGVELDCNCFGQLSSKPISARTLIRNAGLGALALLVAIAGPGTTLGAWTTDRTAANIVAALATTAMIVLAVVLFARRGATIERGDAPARIGDSDLLPQGAPAPDFALPALDGTKVSLAQLLARDRPVVLVFASPVCSPCVGLLPHLARWNSVIGQDLTLVVIESGWNDHQLAEVQREALGGLITLTEPRRDLASAYKAPGTPCAIAVTPDGLISSPPMPGANQVERLIRQVLESGRGLGDPAQAPNLVVSA